MIKGKKRFIKIVVSSVVILLLIISMIVYGQYQKNQKKEAKRLEEGRAKSLIMFVVNKEHMHEYRKPEYDNQCWKGFLQDQYTIRYLSYINEYMEDTYPDSPYTEASVEKLKKKYMQVYYIWNGELYDYINTKEDGKVNLGDVFNRGVISGLEQDIIDLLGYSQLTAQYDYYTTYDDVFLKEKNLKLFLERLNQYMKQEYLDIPYEEITVINLEELKYSMCGQLWEITEELEKRGVEFSKIVEQLHQQVDAANP